MNNIQLQANYIPSYCNSTTLKSTIREQKEVSRF